MIRIVVLYHTGFGHTGALAESVAAGARAEPDTQVSLMKAGEFDSRCGELDAADAIIMGSPTYMGSVSAELKAVWEKTVDRYFEQAWVDKLAAGFTNSASQSGDKLNTLMDMILFAAQHGMHWINLGLLSGNHASTGSAEELNRVGGWIGAMAQSNSDQGVDLTPPESDHKTAWLLGRRVARAARQWKAGGGILDDDAA